MTRFSYRAMALDGRETAGDIDASDKQNVADQLCRQGLLLIEARPLVQRDSNGFSALFALSISASEVTRFLSELSLLLQTGQPIDEALKLLAQDMHGALGKIVRGLHVDLLKGATFVDALGKHPSVFPPELLALVQVSEVTGQLDLAIEAAALQRIRMQALMGKLGGALRYPAFLLLAAVGVLFFFLLYVMPQFASVVRDAGSHASSSIVVLIRASDALRDHLDAFLVFLAALLVAGLMVSRSPSLMRPLRRLCVSLPVINGTIAFHQAALFCMTLGTLLRQGVPVPAALKVIEQIIGVEAGETLSEIGDAVRRGGGLGDALEAHGFLPQIARRMLKIGEEAGELVEVATRAGALYEKKLEQRLDTITAIVGPAAIILISGMIGGLMVTIMTALININQLVF